MKRHVNCHAYVNAACLFPLDSNNTVTKEPRLIFGGLTPKAFFASKTAQVRLPAAKRVGGSVSADGAQPVAVVPAKQYLVGKKLDSIDTIQGAVSVLLKEVRAAPWIHWAAATQPPLTAQPRASLDCPRSASSGSQRRLPTVVVHHAAVQEHPGGPALCRPPVRLHRVLSF